jgi:putative DNA methylase
VIYTHQTTAGWATLIQGLRGAGFSVVEAWPVDTEMTERRGGQDNASLASSIFLVGRRRETEELGSWSQVSDDLERVIAERISRLPELGITGADLVIASVGAGLGPFTRYRDVEMPNGERVRPDDYLDEVQTLVIKSILSELLDIDRSGVEAVDPVTQLYIVGRFEYGDAQVPFDELNTLVHGILAGARARGAELLGSRGLMSGPRALVDQDEDQVRLRDYEERGSTQSLGLSTNGDRSPTVDVFHRLMWLAEHEPRNVKDFLMQSQPDPVPLRMLAQALSGGPLRGKGRGTSAREEEASRRLLAAWTRLVDDNLFQVER